MNSAAASYSLAVFRNYSAERLSVSFIQILMSYAANMEVLRKSYIVQYDLEKRATDYSGCLVDECLVKL